MCNSSSRLAMCSPSLLQISHSTAAGRSPAMRTRSMEASVCPWPGEHAAVAGHQRKHVPRPDEVLGTALLIDDRLNRGAPLERADAGLAIAVIDRHREVRHLLAARRHHRLQIQPAGGLCRHWHADLAAAVRHQEVNELRRDLFRGDDEVALILTILRIQNDDRQPQRQSFQALFDARKAAHIGFQGA